MIVAGWAWDDRILAVEQMSRSAQADLTLLLLAVGVIGLLFSLLAFIADRLDRREWRRGILEAHQPRSLRPRARRGMSATDTQRLLAALSDGRPHKHRDLYRLGLMVHSRAADLRRRGYTVEVWRDGNDYLYRLAGRPEENAA